MKQRMNRRDFLRLSAGLATGTLIAACAPATPAPPAAEQATATPAPAQPTATPVPAQPAATSAPAAAKKQLLFWDQFGAEATAVDEMVANFNKAHPDIEVKRESQPNMRDILKTALDAGTGPDVLYYDTGPGFAGVLARAGLLLPLDDAYAQYGWNQRIFKWAKERTVFDGKTYGIGHELEFVGTFYNQRIFKEQGLSEPKTHEEFLGMCDKLKKAGLIPIAFSDQDKWPAGHMLSVFAGNIAGKDKLAAAISAKVPWNDPDFVQAIQIFFVDMNKAGYFVPEVNAVTYDDANMLLYSGKAATTITGTWQVDPFTNPDNMPDPVGFFFYPSIGGKPIAPPAGLGSGYFVSKATKYPDAAFQFMDYLMSKEAAKYWIEGLAKIPPIAVNAADYKISDLMRFCINALQQNAEKMSYNIDVLTPDNFNTMMFDGFQEVLAGTKTAKQQADDLEKAMQEAKAAGKVMDITR
jgi:raffinose/stachyose/melibiose transport system substrate-binding protein